MIDERMLGYYPEVVKAIYEIQAIVQAEYPEFELQADSLWGLIDEAYLTTMGEERIKQWEQLLSIQPLPDSTIEDRRETIIARIRGNGKLNTESIQLIVNAFTGGRARSWVENSTLYVEIKPPKGNKQYKFENVENELERRKPAHLGFNVSRLYSAWLNIKVEFSNWEEVETEFDTWEDVFYYVKTNNCDWKDVKRFYPTWKNVKNRLDDWDSVYFYNSDSV